MHLATQLMIGSLPAALIPWLDPKTLIEGFGGFALLGICLVIFAETGLLIGFLFPGDTLLIISGILTFSGVIQLPIWVVCLAIGFAAFVGGEVGYIIGNKLGPRVFERQESGIFSKKNVVRTNAFFAKYGGLSVILARFIPVLRTFVPIAAGVGHMSYRKYSLYNLTGAMVWGAGVTYLGFLLGYIPPVATFVEKYIDVILLGAVAITLIPTIFHYIKSSRDARKANRDHDAPLTDEQVTIDPRYFDQKPDSPH